MMTTCPPATRERRLRARLVVAQAKLATARRNAVEAQREMIAAEHALREEARRQPVGDGGDTMGARTQTMTPAAGRGA